MKKLDFFVWLIFRRYFFKFKYVGFESSLFSYVDRESLFSEFNKIHFGSIIRKSKLGRFTYVGKANIYNAVIGSFCSIGPNTKIGGLGKHPVNWVSSHPAFYSTLMQASHTFSNKNYFEELRHVEIGNDVWIGANVLVLDGVKIGNGSIVAAGAVVTKDVEPYAIVGGVPAKVIRFRHDPETIKQLLSLCWWDWPIDKLDKYAELFRNTPSQILYDL